MTTRAKLLLLLTVIGFIVPNVMVGIFLVDHGGDVGLYFENWFETLPAAQLVADLVIAFWAFVIWASWDGPRSGVGSIHLPDARAGTTASSSPLEPHRVRV